MQVGSTRTLLWALDPAAARLRCHTPEHKAAHCDGQLPAPEWEQPGEPMANMTLGGRFVADWGWGWAWGSKRR